MKKTIVFFLSLLFLSGCGSTSFSIIKLNASSKYSTEGWVYSVKKNKKNIGIVFLHGKRGNPDTSHNDEFISNMTNLGYTVIAPLMPWSETRGYNGTRTQGMEIIEAAVNSLKTKKVVIIGHSMGGMAVIQYGAKNTASKVVGLIPIAAAHDPHTSGKLYENSTHDIGRACGMMKNGKGKEYDDFTDVNMGSVYTINTTAEYYCTYFSLVQYPGSLQISEDIKLPTLVISGDEDRLTYVYRHEQIYNDLKNKKSKYLLLNGDHIDVLYKHTNAISKWIDSL